MSGKGKPRFTGKAGEYQWRWFLPASKLVRPVPIKVWCMPVEKGWLGWLESQRKGGSVLPGFYAKDSWKETTEKKADLAQQAAKAAQAVANVGPAAKAAKGLTGKEMRERAVAAGKAERAAKAGPGVAKTAVVEPEPEPEPTGTDPSGPGNETVTNDPATIAGALETAVQTLASVAQGLRRIVADGSGKARTVAPVAKPGLRKAVPAVAPAPLRRKGVRR